MSYQEQQQQQAHLNPLAQIPLIKSPFVRFPQAVLLPYNYVPSPDLSALPVIRELPADDRPHGPTSSERLSAIALAEQRWQAWEDARAEARLREARRIAPGFLDTGVTMLTPTVTARPGSVAPTEGDPRVEKAEDYSSQFASLKF